jgi:DNA-directed RNA polymerase specialized sigma24 family protein
MTDSMWPNFLNKLDSNPDTAFREFYKLAYYVYNTTPPIPLRNLPSEESEELKDDIIYHCVKDNFRVLRLYQSKGKPFAAWFYTLASNKCRDYLRKKGRQPETVPIDSNPDNLSLADILHNKNENSEYKIDFADFISITKKAISQLEEYCKLLLEMAADEFTPKEMVLVLRLPKDQNKKVSDDLRECRRRLTNLLAQDGYDIKSLIMS